MFALFVLYRCVHVLLQEHYSLRVAQVSASHTFFFFFQAEDGIRDADVTGVQTCALPICSASIFLPSSTLVPSMRTTTGSRRPSFFTAAITPSASRSQRRMPPKTLMKTA